MEIDKFFFVRATVLCENIYNCLAGACNLSPNWNVILQVTVQGIELGPRRVPGNFVSKM